MIDEKIREQKLKFIEILLIVGGIIGGLSENPSNKMILAWFLISSLMYYRTVSNQRALLFSFSMLWALQVSLAFSVLITSPIFSGPPVLGPNIDKPISLIILICLFILIFKSLQEVSEEKPDD